ncbi:MAG: aminopeptidase P N-terminal domain-containing protein [Chthoniobacter sp.]|nr:aminopeptidase P N-terminal domain-containing protein [Chthoniobacter sp.]
MRHTPISPQLFIENRERLCKLLRPKSLAALNNNDVLPTNADGTLVLRPNADLFYLTGIEQEESLLVLFPEASDERHREILFLRETSPLIETWEGKRLSKDEAKAISGIARVEWLSEFPVLFRLLMCEAENVYLNANEHPRASVTVETREARFVRDTQRAYPLHRYHRLAPLLHALRPVKSEAEVTLLRKACAITGDGFRRVARFVKPSVTETQVEAELAHEFISQNAGFAYSPIIASGANACALHYSENSALCRDGDLLLLDAAAGYANYNADLTRTIPVNGRFTRRQRQIYDAVLRVYRVCEAALRPGLTPGAWRDLADETMTKELVDLKLITAAEMRKQGPEKKALRKYFMHGIGHPIGLDVHDVSVIGAPMQAGWVVTCEPGIYIPAEKLGVRLEDTVLITAQGPESLMADIPMEAGEIEALMARGKPKRR